MHELVHLTRKASTTKTQREHSRSRVLRLLLIARSHESLKTRLSWWFWLWKCEG